MSFDRERAIEIAKDPIAEARRVAQRTGKPIIGTISSWSLDSLVIAAGAIPVRLPAMSGGQESGTRARAHLQASSCFLSQSILEDGLAGKLDFLDALLFVQTCDAQQNLSDIWKIAVPSIPVVDMYMPVNRNSRGSAGYIVSELERTRDDLGKITSTVANEQMLCAAMEARLQVERALDDLYRARLEADGRVPAMDHYAACVAASCLSPDEGAGIVQGLVDDIRSGEAVRPGEVPGCMLLGSTLPYPGLYELFDILDVAVRDDDLSIGRRLFDRNVPDEGAPLDRITRSLLERTPGSTKYDDGVKRGEAVVRAARRADVKHVVMPLLKFCDPWAWNYPAIRDALEKVGLGMLMIELGGGEDMASGTIRNRVEAYFEMDTVGDLFDE